MSEDSSPTQSTQLELADWQEQIRLAVRKAKNPNLVLVRIRSYRLKLLDRDNLFPKYFIDALRYSGLIRDDTTRHVVLDVDQEEVATEGEERTEINLVYPDRDSLVNHNPPSLFS